MFFKRSDSQSMKLAAHAVYVCEGKFSGVSAVCKQFEWNSPDVIRRIKAGEPVGDELRKKVTLLFSRTHGGRVYAVEIETTVESVFRAADGTRTTDEIAVATSLPRGKVSDIMTSLAEIGAVVVPPDFPA